MVEDMAMEDTGDANAVMLTLMLLLNLNRCHGMVEDMVMGDTGDANVVMLTLMPHLNLKQFLGMVEDMAMEDTGDANVVMLTLMPMQNLKLKPHHPTICTILITMYFLLTITLENGLLMPNLSHGGEDMDTEDEEDTGVANDALPRL